MRLLKGTVDGLVLTALSFGPRHGFEITRWIEDGSRGEFPIESAGPLPARHPPAGGRLGPPGAAGPGAAPPRVGAPRKHRAAPLLHPAPGGGGPPPRRGRIAADVGRGPLH